MGDSSRPDQEQSRKRLEKAYRSERPRLLARLRRAGRTLEEAEDLIHDVYAETMECLPLVGTIRNLPAWINSLFRRRMIDLWRHEQARSRSGETDIAEETLREIIAGAGLDPLDVFVRTSLVEALNAAMRALPSSQRRVVEAPRCSVG
jgi:RNA polymerase sigma factor (sigma-70 family)